MEHKWFLNKYDTSLCVNCNAVKHWWIRHKNGELKIQYYIMKGNTQYGHTHKCNSELVIKTLF